MIDTLALKKIFKILNFASALQKKKLILLTLFSIVTSLFEVFSVYIIIPVYKIVVDKVSINEIVPWINSIFKITFQSQSQEQLYGILFFTIIFIISNTLKTLTIWQASKQTGAVGAYLFGKAYSVILTRPYELISSQNLSKFASNFLTTNTFFVCILKNIILLINYLTTSVIIIISLLIINPGATLFAVLFLLIPYLIIIKFSKPQFYKNSTEISLQVENINRNMVEAFKSLKTIHHYQVQNYYTKIFYIQESKLRSRVAKTELLEQYPRNLLEVLGLTMLSILYVCSILINDINISIVFLIALIFSCQKLLPSLQQIYRIYAYILAYSFSINDLHDYFYERPIIKRRVKFVGNSIKFKNVFFNYKNSGNNLTEKNDALNKKKFLLNNINLEIKIPSSISVTGNSGCGKTTFVDLLTGLLSPSKGYIYLPEQVRKNKNIGYVPQEVPIINGSFLENLSFGNKELIKDKEYLNKCLYLTGLTKILKHYPAGLNTILGERAINLSGGQKQRIGIARALLIRPKILILDESTNALDQQSQTKIIDNLISEFSESFIIFITHNNSIKKKCMHNIQFDQNGEIIYK